MSAPDSSQDYSVLRWGVAGAGKISTDFVSAVQTDSGDKHKFIAVASRNAENARAFAMQHRIPLAYGSYEALAADKSIQIVYIGNLNPDHDRTARLFLDHGKHVLVEKPLTLNAKQTESLCAYARSRNLLLMEALWSRFLPSYRFAFERISAGAIGEPRSVDASFGVASLDSVDRVSSRSLGGGTILDLGCYVINCAQMAFANERPISIKVIGGELNASGVDLSMNAQLQYSNGKNDTQDARIATLRTSATEDLPNEATIIGSRGSVKFEKPFHATQHVVITTSGKVERFEFLLGANTEVMNFANSRGLRHEADEMRDLLIAGKRESAIMPHRDSVTIAAIQDELRRALSVRFDADNQVDEKK